MLSVDVDGWREGESGILIESEKKLIEIGSGSGNRRVHDGEAVSESENMIVDAVKWEMD